jgi:hypothetical protein
MPRTLLQENDTRWNSLLKMLESVTSQEVEMKQLLSGKDELHRIENIDFVLLRQFCSFLQPLKEAAKSLEGDKHPTLHLVALWYHKLLAHANFQPLDGELMKQLKGRLAEALKIKFVVSPIR